MKRIRIKAIVKDDATSKQDMKQYIEQQLHGEMEEFRESIVPKDGLPDYSFEELLHSGWEFAEGIWITLKGFAGMMKWAVVCIVSGLKYLWRGGVGKQKAEEKHEK